MDEETVAEYFDEWAAYYDDSVKNREWIVPHRLSKAIEPFVAHNTDEPLRVLDVGIGTGMLSRQLRRHYSHAHITGLDVSYKMLEECRRKKTADCLIRADAQQRYLPVAGPVYDLTVSSGVSEFFENPQNVFSEMVRITRPGGIVALSYMPTLDAKSDFYKDGYDITTYCRSRRRTEEIFSNLAVKKLIHTRRFTGYRICDEPRMYAIFVGQVPERPAQTDLSATAANKFPRKAL